MSAEQAAEKPAGGKKMMVIIIAAVVVLVLVVGGVVSHIEVRENLVAKVERGGNLQVHPGLTQVTNGLGGKRLTPHQQALEIDTVAANIVQGATT